MKLQFKVQQYQTEAVEAVVACFAGQPREDGLSYRIDPGKGKLAMEMGLRNADLALSAAQLLDNIQAVQRARGLPSSTELVNSKAGRINLDIEMETGTGKSYVYIKTMMELHKRYGWSKFIVVVPSIAIREGVKKSFEITADHFQQAYGSKPRAFIYNSAHLHELERFSSDAGVQVMIINIQAFNATGKDARRIYDILDDFQSRKPIDVIAANRPIVIIDEPQKIGAKSLEALAHFNALFVLRYSATHKVEHNKVHRLDALDAYNQKLVKRIAVRGITVRGLPGTTAYMYLQSIEIGKSKPRARMELEVQTQGSIKRQVMLLGVGDNLHDISHGIEAYKGLFIRNIDAIRDEVELSNGDTLTTGQVTADGTEQTKRRIQIREVISAHLAKERELFGRGVKVLSLFFIDEVAKYRDYNQADTKGQYAQWFEEEYRNALAIELSKLDLNPFSAEYRKHLEEIAVERTHIGYFSIDKKTNRQIDSDVKTRGEEAGQSTDVDAYDLILKAKEKLLSFEEQVRFIFSHSALREGWDNPNVFVMGILKKSDNTISRRQEIGRGLRLSVNQDGERMDNPATVHHINELTVVTDESYTDFVTGLQREIAESLSQRPRKITEKTFIGMSVLTEVGSIPVNEQMSRAIYNHLVRNDYVDDDGNLTETYHTAKEAGTLAVPNASALNSIATQVWGLVEVLQHREVKISDGRKPKQIPLNRDNFDKREFQELWNRINYKAVYQVEFDSTELIRKCVYALDHHLKVAPLQYVIHVGKQTAEMDVDQLASGGGFSVESIDTHTEKGPAVSQVKYDLLGEITEKTQLTRRTVGTILSGVNANTFAMYAQNPEQFITECAKIINEQKATAIVEHLTYDTLNERYDMSIFTANQSSQDFSKAGEKLKRHIYDYVVTDSDVERKFVTELDNSEQVVVYAKLPRGFSIPTPVGNYNPDWAIAFKEGAVKHIYFVAETKGSLSSLQLREVEKAKIDCAQRFFDRLNDKHAAVKYDVVRDFGQLMQVVGAG